MSAFAGERAVVIGLGASGLAAARVLAEEGASVRASEERPASALEGLEGLDGLGVEILAGGHAPEHLDRATVVVASPGVPERAPVLLWARERGIRVWSELEIGARLCRVPYVAITGTNGKSTTTEMVASCMRAAGLDAIACGNIGHPFSLAVREGHEALAVEASSFQLRFHETFHPKVSVLLNLAEDHLDWHGSFDAYVAAKARVFELQGEGDVHVGNAEDRRTSSVSRQAPCRVVWFRLVYPRAGEVGFVDGEVVARLEGTVDLGRPSAGDAGFRADAAAAAAAALSFGLSPSAVGEGIRSTRRLPHRGQEVARIGCVRFVDDSKATNPHAALAAVRELADAVLIAGGLSKGVDLSTLAAAVPNLAGVVAIGKAAPEIAAVFEGHVPVRKAESMEDAVGTAYELASAGIVMTGLGPTPPDRTVILAPACASQDMFRDYKERGERFAAAADELAREVAGG